MKSHEHWMREALQLAARGEGLTRPNPPVGAVVVKNGRKVGEGWHRKAGGPHAEIHALKQAGGKARGAFLYVTLEPCSTQGRTPPCTEAVIAAGIKEVFICCKDLNPSHAGRAAKVLRKNNIQVTWGPLKEEGTRLVEPFFTWMNQKRPYLTLKLGMTLDGQLGDRNGKSRWITGSKARTDVQQLRRSVDAVMVGTRTVLQDNPSLLPRPPKGRKPYRVILDYNGRIPLNRQVFADGAQEQTLVVSGPAYPPKKMAQLEGRGVQFISFKTKRRPTMKRALSRLHAFQIMHVLCEGGGKLAGSLVKENVVDRYLFYIGSSILGSKGSTHAVEGFSYTMDDKALMTIDGLEKLGEDVKITAYPKG